MNSEIVHQIIAKVNKTFSEDEVEKLARDSGFIQRSTGKINPFGFLIVFVVQLSMNGTLTLNALCELLKPYSNELVTSQALSLRLGSKHTVRFLRRCYAYIISKKTRSSRDSIEKAGLFSKFTNILIEDSSYCKLHEKVANSYKGYGGSASDSAYKIHTTWNATTQEIRRLDVTAGNVTDQSHGFEILKDLKAGDLVIRDLGYFSIPCFKSIQDENAYFLSRLKVGVKIYTTDGEEIKDLPKYLDKKRGSSPMVEVNILIGANQKFPVRLIAYSVSESVFNQRRRKQRRTNQKSGYGLSKNSKSHARYTLLITNIPEELVTLEKFLILYGFRWQIELLFKTYKSQLKIHMIKGQNKERVECYIISRLIAITAITEIFSVLMEYVKKEYGRELSFDKFVSWILRNQYLMILMQPENMNYWVIEMKDLNILLLCKQQRTRKTSRELLEIEASAWDKYPLACVDEGEA